MLFPNMAVLWAVSTQFILAINVHWDDARRLGPLGGAYL